MNDAAEHGCDFALAAPSEPVLRVPDLAGVTSLFPVAGLIPDPDSGQVS